jgi:hypothetical protein
MGDKKMIHKILSDKSVSYFIIFFFLLLLFFVATIIYNEGYKASMVTVVQNITENYCVKPKLWSGQIC